MHFCSSCEKTHRIQPPVSPKSSYVSGFRRGRDWPDKWETHPNPGGPLVFTNCKLSVICNAAWLKGWKVGHKAKLDGVKLASPKDVKFSFETNFELRVVKKADLITIDNEIRKQENKLHDLRMQRNAIVYKNNVVIV